MILKQSVILRTCTDFDTWIFTLLLLQCYSIYFGILFPQSIKDVTMRHELIQELNSHDVLMVAKI